MKIIFLVQALLLLYGCAFVDRYHYTESDIRVNQVGYLTFGKKQAVVVAPLEDSFSLKDLGGNEVFTGQLLEKKHWDKSGEDVSVADFSAITRPGTYTLTCGEVTSYPFKISENPYDNLLKASIKSFYFHRASTALEQKYSGPYQRPVAHPDTAVFVHVSGASDQRPAGYKITSPYGWYDAGDYNKYMVNSGIATYTLLATYQHNKPLLDSLDLNIPESNNDFPDLLDEILWNVRWMETMQDPNDGGVYHKLTTANFEAFVPPTEARGKRYVVAKGTAATLNFCAVLAKMAVVLQDKDPLYAEALLQKAEKAWSWALDNPDVPFKNPESVALEFPSITTGEYGDRMFKDEFFWAAIELYLATGKDEYLEKINFDDFHSFSVPAWNSVETLGLFSLASGGPQVPEKLKKRATDQLLRLAENLITLWRESPYKTTINDFRWGSNSTVLNQGLILVNAYRVMGNSEFYEAALSGLDYVLGRNAAGYCFVTGHGSRSPKNIHHRISAADEIDEPVPGMLVGGPNPRNVKQDCGADSYPVKLPARCYLDAACSYSTNEVAINWNAPLVYMVSSLQTIYQNDFKSKY